MLASSSTADDGALASAPADSDGLPRRAALLVAGTLFMELFDGTVLTTAVAPIASSFDVGVGAVALPITIYLTTVAALIPVSGWIADRYGARRMFAIAVVLFTLASAACAAAPNLMVLIAARVVQGTGGALMVPIGRLIVMRETRPEHVIRAIAYLTWPALAAPILAPVVGGVITTYASWRWIFLVNIPLGAIALLCTGLIDSQPARRRPMDWTGFALCAVGLVALTVAVSLLAEREVALVPALTLLVAALLVGVASVRHLVRSPHPLLHLTVLRVRTFRITVSGGSVYRAAVNGVPFLIPLLLQERFGWTPARAGLYLSALFVGGALAKPTTGMLFRRLGFRRVLVLAVAGSGATIGACAFLHPGVPAAVIALLLATTGGCRSIVMSVFQALSMADLNPDEVGDANTLFSTLLQLFTGLGVSAGALALRLGTATAPADAYAIAFGLLAVLMSVPLWEALTLSPRAAAGLLARNR